MRRDDVPNCFVASSLRGNDYWTCNLHLVPYFALARPMIFLVFTNSMICSVLQCKFKRLCNMPTFIICNIFQVWWGLLCNISCRPNKCLTSFKWWWTRSIIENWCLKSNYTFYLFENAIYMYKPKSWSFLNIFLLCETI